MPRHPLAAGEALIALGGNQGDVLAAFRRALAGLWVRAVEVTAVSRAYRTIAVVPPEMTADANDYWNAAVRARIAQSPDDLLLVLQALEAEAGRQRTRRFAARPLDLDLLAYGGVVVDTPTLTLPHPRLRERTFVLRPLADIAAETIIPGLAATAQELLSRLADPDAGILEVRDAWWLP